MKDVLASESDGVEWTLKTHIGHGANNSKDDVGDCRDYGVDSTTDGGYY